MSYWKVLTHDYRPPIQGGEPLFSELPCVLPTVELDCGDSDCAAGWNFVDDLAIGIQIAGLWRTGRPNVFVAVEPSADVIRRGQKLRSSGLTVTRFATDVEIQDAILRFSAPFSPHTEAMAQEQWLWYQAIGRPLRDREAVIAGLRAAIDARNLPWTLKEYPTARDARDAWAAWDARDARDARDAWAAWDAWDARDAWAAWDAWAARDARDARDAWDAWAARDARDAWDAWDAWAALTVQFASRSGWITRNYDVLTVGIRDAYRNGLGVAIPTGENELGWTMEA